MITVLPHGLGREATCSALGWELLAQGHNAITVNIVIFLQPHSLSGQGQRQAGGGWCSWGLHGGHRLWGQPLIQIWREHRWLIVSKLVQILREDSSLSWKLGLNLFNCKVSISPPVGSLCCSSGCHSPTGSLQLSTLSFWSLWEVWINKGSDPAAGFRLERGETLPNTLCKCEA